MKLIRVDRNKSCFFPLPTESELPNIVFVRERSVPDGTKQARVNLPQQLGMVVAYTEDKELVDQLETFYPRSTMALAVIID